MSLNERFLEYTDLDGLMQPGPGQGSLNGILYTGIAVIALSLNKALNWQVIEVYSKGILACERTPGLLWRTPRDNNDQESQDDYIGALAFSKYCDKGALAKRILSKGSKLSLVRWAYNNQNPGTLSLASWFGRFPALIASMHYAAGETPNSWFFLGWSIAMLTGAFAKKSNQDSWILPWVMYNIAKDRTFFGQPLLWFWNLRFRSVWGNPGALFESYFNSPNQPLGVYLRKL